MWGISLRKIVLKCVTRQTVSRHSRKYQPYFDRALESISLYYQATRYIAVDWKDKEILWQISTFKFAAFFTLPRLIDQRETSVSGLPHHAWSHFSAWGHYIPFKHNMLSLSLSYKEELNFLQQEGNTAKPLSHFDGRKLDHIRQPQTNLELSGMRFTFWWIFPFSCFWHIYVWKV